MCTELIVVLHSPPQTSGSRTVQRVDAARAAIGCDSFEIINLYLTARWTVNDWTAPETQAEAQTWRIEVEKAMGRNQGGDLLLAYGVQEPRFPERAAYREKITWIQTLVVENRRRVWMLGQKPHHPSRWQRVTARERPLIPFEVAMCELLQRVTL